MAKTTYKKRVINGKEYYYYRIRFPGGKYKDVYAPTVKELKEKIKLPSSGIIITRDNYGDYLKDWLYNTLLIDKKPSTKERYDSIFRNYIEDSPIYYIKLSEISSIHIQTYYNQLIENGKSIATIKNLHKIIAPSIKYAYNNNRICKDFSKALVIPKDNKINKEPNVKPFTIDEQFKFLEIIRGTKLEMLFITALDTGMRQGELLALTWNDVDLTNRTITVNKTYKVVKDLNTEKYVGTIQPPKTQKGTRTIPIPVHLANKLKQYKVKQKELRLKSANLYEDNNLVFCNEFGKYLDSSNILKLFKKILKDNKLEDRKFHDLRHTYATRLFELGENAKTVQTILGHSNISITLDTYTHVLEDMKVKAISKLDNLYINTRA